MLQFPEGYYEDEVREGFYVNGLMKRCWAAQLEILSDIEQICDKYNIKWFIDCGTLLGAVRHGGFVPWDDDVDICMLRDDYMRFIEIADKELKLIWKGYKLQNFRNGDYWEVISRVVDMHAINFNEDRMEKFHGFPLEVGVDIFPIDYLCADRKKEEERMAVCNAIFSIADDDRLAAPDEYINEMLAAIESATGYVFDRKKSLQMQLYEIGEKMFSLYGREQADKVALMGYWLKDESHSYDLAWFENTVRLPFENTALMAPIGYDEVLKREYGDYMRIVRTGGAHNYPRYEWQLEKLEKEMGTDSPFHKKVDRGDLSGVHRIYGEGNPRAKVKNQILELMDTVGEAHDELRKQAHEDNAEACLVMLEDLQGAAIQIGTFIEESYGEGINVIKHFEKYCEDVYRIHEELSSGVRHITEIDGLCKGLDEQLQVMNKGVSEALPVRREVVFLPYKASLWCYMEELWQKCMEDDKTDVYVIPIPYYDKLPVGTLGKQHYEKDMFPDEVSVTDYGDYNFEERQPDSVYIVNPFDMGDHSTTVHPYFYAKKLKTYTDDLVYIQAFKLEEIQPGEERAYKAMDHYAVSAGVVYADRVYVQSEHMKGLYVRKLKEYFGEDTGKLWENKIIGGGLAVYDPMPLIPKNEIAMPDSWRRLIFCEDGKVKKVILYYTGLSELYDYKERMLSKIRAAFDTFRDNGEMVAVLWWTDPLIDAVLPSVDQKLYDAFKELVKDYKEEGIGIYDETRDESRAVMLADAFYGDPGRLVSVFRARSLPIMLQNVEVL